MAQEAAKKEGLRAAQLMRVDSSIAALRSKTAKKEVAACLIPTVPGKKVTDKATLLKAIERLLDDLEGIRKSTHAIISARDAQGNAVERSVEIRKGKGSGSERIFSDSDGHEESAVEYVVRVLTAGQRSGAQLALGRYLTSKFAKEGEAEEAGEEDVSEGLTID